MPSFTLKALKAAPKFVLDLLPDAVYAEFAKKHYVQGLAQFKGTFLNKLPFDFTQDQPTDLLKLAHLCKGVKPQSLTTTTICMTESNYVFDRYEKGIAHFAVDLRAMCSAKEWPTLKQHLDKLKESKQLSPQVCNLLKKHSWEWFFVQMLYKAADDAAYDKRTLLKAVRNYATAVLKAEATNEASEKVLAKLKNKALAAMTEMAVFIRAKPASGFILEDSEPSQELPVKSWIRSWPRPQTLYAADDVIVDATFKLLAMLDDLCPTQLNSDARVSKASKQLYQVLCFFKALLDVYVMIKDFPSELELQHLTSTFEWCLEAEDDRCCHCADLSRTTWRNGNFKKLRFTAKLKPLTGSDIRLLLISTDTFKRTWTELIDPADTTKIWMGHRRQKHLAA